MRINNQFRTAGHAILKRTMFIGLLFAAGASVHANQMGVTPSSLNFPTQTVGSMSASITLTLTNNSHNQIRVTGITSSLPQFTFSRSLTLPATLGPNQSLQVFVNFRPASAQTYSGNLTFAFNKGWMASASLNGTGVPAPPAPVPASTVTAPPVITTQPNGQTVTVGQTASFSVAATGPAPLSYQWYKNTTAITGATSASYTTPATSTTDNGALFKAVVADSGGSVSSASATLTVNPVPTYSLAVNPTSLAFGNVAIGASPTAKSTLSNTGNSSITVSNVSIAGSGFGVTGVSTGQILAPGQSTSVSVTFTPATTASVTGSVTITSNATNSPTAITLSGTGTQPVSHDVSLSWSPSASTVVGYNVYRGAVTGGPYTKITSSPNSTMSYVDRNVQAGSTYYYTVTSVDANNMESPFSNETSAVIP